VGVFGYSDEEGTTAQALPDQIAEDVIRERVNRAGELVEIVVNSKAKSRIGQQDSVLIENVASSTIEGRGSHQGPEVDGSVLIQDQIQVKPGDLIQVEYVESDGADLVARVLHG
jgi:tRNA A37 methylthiotransferase MiaB